MQTGTTRSQLTCFQCFLGHQGSSWTTSYISRPGARAYGCPAIRKARPGPRVPVVKVTGKARAQAAEAPPPSMATERVSRRCRPRGELPMPPGQGGAVSCQGGAVSCRCQGGAAAVTELLVQGRRGELLMPGRRGELPMPRPAPDPPQCGHQ